MNERLGNLWIEKYRPLSLKQIILPSSIKRTFMKFIKDEEIPSLLFFSKSPGSGKTSTAKAICEDLKCDYIYINTSLENGIDIIRSKIERFASTIGFSQKRKIVILDEFDGSTRNLQDALRASIEEFKNTCRFIITCNYITKIIDPIQSRCQVYDFNFMDKKIQDEIKPKIYKRLEGILKFEKVEYSEEILKKIIDIYYPDIRKMIGILHQYSKQNGMVDNGIFSYDKIDDEFFQLVLSKQLSSVRKYILEKSYNYSELYRSLFDNLIPLLDKEKRAPVILYIAEYMYRDSTVIDKEINFTACLIEIMNLI
jgi:DNA polymerase III delta prime subunit